MLVEPITEPKPAPASKQGRSSAPRRPPPEPRPSKPDEDLGAKWGTPVEELIPSRRFKLTSLFRRGAAREQPDLVPQDVVAERVFDALVEPMPVSEAPVEPIQVSEADAEADAATEPQSRGRVRSLRPPRATRTRAPATKRQPSVPIEPKLPLEDGREALGEEESEPLEVAPPGDVVAEQGEEPLVSYAPFPDMLPEPRPEAIDVYAELRPDWGHQEPAEAFDPEPHRTSEPESEGVAEPGPVMSTLCARCHQPSPRPLCEVCGEALDVLRALSGSE